MANMSYCRFQNTAQDLQDCIDAIQNGDANNLSGDELNALKNLKELAETLVDLEYEIEGILEMNANK
tara:strand:+ start:578 stop:778 length:201 start_codon:yes stop_codon:yes gene_type:complete